MNPNRRQPWRASGTPATIQHTHDALHHARVLHRASVLQGSTLDVLQTIAPLFPKASPEAIAIAGIVLQAPADGHTCLEYTAIANRWNAAYPNADASPSHAPRSASDIRRILRDTPALCAAWDPATRQYPPEALLVEAFDRVYLHRSAVTEHTISQALHERMGARPTRHDSYAPYVAAFQPQMTAAQFQALNTALREQLMLLVGGPGTGKTWTVRAILAVEFAAAIREQRTLPRVALAAPTGKAAARMLESIRANLHDFLDAIGHTLLGGDADGRQALQHAITELDAKTLHRLLPNPSYDRDDTYIHADIVIVDEVSMVDAPMMSRLLTALDPDTSLMLIGDPNQLASVEAGSVLADLVACFQRHDTLRPHLVTLTESRRFTDESTVGRLADATLNNAPARPIWRKVLRETPTDGPLSQHLINELADGYAPLLQAVDAMDVDPHETPSNATLDRRAQQAFQALDRFALLCARRSGPRSVPDMNAAITHALVHRRKMRAPDLSGLSVGMPIMILRNDYNIRRFNGDIGVVTSPNIVSFLHADGSSQHLAASRLPEHRLAFAMTIHKSQGSEWDTVRVLLPHYTSRILSRELIYTAISRARTDIEILGAHHILRHAIAQRAERATGLVDVMSSQLPSHSK